MQNKVAHNNSNDKKIKYNYGIKCQNVRLIKDSQNLGVISTKDAMQHAIDAESDLIQISDSDPPVCIIEDFGKYKYTLSQRNKKKLKSSNVVEQKEVRFGPNIDKHDIFVKINQVKSFIAQGKHVLLRVKFNKREKAHKDRGFAILKEVLTEVSLLCDVQSPPALAGGDVLAKVSPKIVQE